MYPMKPTNNHIFSGQPNHRGSQELHVLFTAYYEQRWGYVPGGADVIDWPAARYHNLRLRWPSRKSQQI